MLCSSLFLKILCDSLVQIIPQQLRAAGVAQLAQRLCFDLPHPFPGHVELLAQLFQRAGTAILQTKAQGDDPLLPGRQAFKDVQQLPPQQLTPGFVHRDTGIFVLNKVL